MTNALVSSQLPILSAVGSLDSYIHAVHQVPVLSQEEEQSLALRYRSEEDLDAAKQLVLSHLRFAASKSSSLR